MSLYRKRSGIMLAYPFEESRLVGPGRKHWNQWPVLTQPKLNGERAIQLSPGSSTLLSSTESPIWSVPHINRFLDEHLVDTGIQLDGELYRHGLNFETISSIVSREVNLHPDHEKIRFYVFDIVDTTRPNVERALLLENLLKKLTWDSSAIKIVPTRLAHNYEEVLEHYREYLDNGYEGIIIRHPFAKYAKKRVTTMLKFKPRERDHYKIIGTREELDKNGLPKNSLGALVCSDGAHTFRVGSGFTQEQRQTLWQNRETLPGKIACIEYQNLSAKGVPVFSTIVSIGESK